MIELITTKKQTPSVADNWLYKDENEIRVFRKLVFLPESKPAWAECTTAEKEQWEAEHPEPVMDKAMEEQQ